MIEWESLSSRGWLVNDEKIGRVVGKTLAYLSVVESSALKEKVIFVLRSRGRRREEWKASLDQPKKGFEGTQK